MTRSFPASCGVAVLALLAGCGSSLATQAASNGLTFLSSADFAASAVASLSQALAKTTTAQCADLSSTATDNPVLADGLDCDADGGLVAHITPTTYTIALKKLTLRGSDSSTADLPIIADTGTLANAQLVTFTTSSTTTTLLDIAAADLGTGTYAGVSMEIYYVQLTFPVAGVSRNVRIYMSDDDFAAEGSRGHHQGDITFVGSDGTELGWIDSTWTTAGLTSTRGTAQNGAGGTDAETGHARGFFGDATFWNATAQVQGSGQDRYVTTVDFSSPLVVPETPLFQIDVTLAFSVADTFYYEDFAPRNTTEFPGFYPGTGGEATSVTTEWAPQFPSVALTLGIE